MHYKSFVQDTFHVSPKLTLDFGVRCEFHPGYSDAGLNTANFDRTIPRTGQVIIPSDPKALTLVAPATRQVVSGIYGFAWKDKGELQ